MASYEPGVCNIGRRQVRLRYLLGAIGFAAAAAYLPWFVTSGLPDPYLLAVFFPLLIGFEGVLQGRTRFCATFGISGVYDFAGSGGRRGRVEEEEARRRDLRKAVRIHLYSLLGAVLATLILYLLATA